ncbi:cytochrome P450 [Deinococcus fonticola]|uniref:cytochrome P450 n=1 Tax=Deinococcus fonticola TaxID=2528713 RepID=UPI0010755C75|nr:cytochrome P450 [Deinococcus fonticola]
MVVYGHREVLEVVTQPQLYSSAVSRHLQLPNGLDGAEHAAFRALIDPYLMDGGALQSIESMAREVMQALLADLPLPATVEAVTDLGAKYAVRVQQRWLGWQPGLEPCLLAWMEENRAARAFDEIIQGELALRRDHAGYPAGDDVTSRLMRDDCLGRPLREEELVSILRNWTAGDLGSLALCTGVVLHALAESPALQAHLRAGLPVPAFDRVLDELLRQDSPFVANRRRATQHTTLAGVDIPAGTVVHVNWTAANRDPRTFSHPDGFGPEENAPANIVYGAGPHACPGRALSTLELRVFTQELLNATTRLSLGGETERELPPGGGYARVPLRLE